MHAMNNIQRNTKRHWLCPKDARSKHLITSEQFIVLSHLDESVSLKKNLERILRKDKNFLNTQIVKMVMERFIISNIISLC